MYTPYDTACQPKLLRYPALSLFLQGLGATGKSLSFLPVLPEQFYSPPATTHKVPGEVALMHAVLEDAIHCFREQFIKNGKRVQRLAKEAEEWVFADDYSWPFSFVNICTVLGLNPEFIRLGLKHWRQQPPAKPQRQRRRAVPASQLLKTAA